MKSPKKLQKSPNKIHKGNKDGACMDDTGDKWLKWLISHQQGLVVLFKLTNKIQYNKGFEVSGKYGSHGCPLDQTANNAGGKLESCQHLFFYSMFKVLLTSAIPDFEAYLPIQPKGLLLSRLLLNSILKRKG